MVNQIVHAIHCKGFVQFLKSSSPRVLSHKSFTASGTLSPIRNRFTIYICQLDSQIVRLCC